MGRLCDDLKLELYRFPVGRYIMFYQISNDYIEIFRVLHSARDFYAIIEGWDQES